MARRKHTSADTDYKPHSKDGQQDRDGWRTPQPLLECVRTLFGGQIQFDPCTDAENPTHARFYGTPQVSFEHGLLNAAPEARTTIGPRFTALFMNPPFSARRLWVKWFWSFVRAGVLLVPVETSLAWQLAAREGWIVVRPKRRIAFDLPPQLLAAGVENKARPGGPMILFVVGFTAEAVRAAFTDDYDVLTFTKRAA